MTAGIYMYSFSSGKFYVGKSVNIEKRWEQHLKSMEEGTAAKAVQAEFYASGIPFFEIIRSCHPDHLDILEPVYIQVLSKLEGCLNTSIPPIHFDPHPGDTDSINGEDDLFDMSTMEHIREIKRLRAETKSVHSNRQFIKIERELRLAQSEITNLKKLLLEEKNKSWLDKIFSL